MYNPQDDEHTYCADEGAFPPPSEQGMLVLPLVLSDLKERAAMGRKKYNNDYRVHTRENPLQEAYEEALDLVMYLRAHLEQEK
jgi:hypothetical protein